jgi:hypothetical protein
MYRSDWVHCWCKQFHLRLWQWSLKESKFHEDYKSCSQFRPTSPDLWFECFLLLVKYERQYAPKIGHVWPTSHYSTSLKTTKKSKGYVTLFNRKPLLHITTNNIEFRIFSYRVEEHKWGQLSEDYFRTIEQHKLPDSKSHHESIFYWHLWQETVSCFLHSINNEISLW